MLRRQFLAAAAAVGMAFSVSAFAAPVEGQDYVVLEKPIVNADKTLIKVKDYHLHTKGKYGNQGDDVLAVLWVEDEAAGRDPTDEGSLHKKAKFALYQAYHDKKERWDAGEDAFLKTALDAAGMSRADFDQKKNDPKVQALVKSWKDCTYDVAKVQGVPAFVVNGKYLLKTASITSIDSMVDNIRELSKK